ncbi:MAG: four helix bundle protein [Candidatus Kuenenia stuttgartiensis]|nr:four helix bundle protein [Candidatus Kuenenia stuttgartiensis]MCL4727048.1 four helix bundle protein [Candidatus Kuenenia stuttgartiensis]
MRRAALSIPANIAEAFGRYHINDKINFYYFSRGSVAETQNHLGYGLIVRYFHQADISMIDHKLNKLYESINRLIKSLKSQPQPQPQPGYTKL